MTELRLSFSLIELLHQSLDTIEGGLNRMDANTLAKYIGKEHVEEVQTLMENDSQLLNKVSFKNPVVALVLSIFLGIVGIDRLYQGGVSVFACKLLLCLLTFGVWWIADLGYSVIMTKETNYKKIIAAAA